jgi:hypothetical protein
MADGFGRVVAPGRHTRQVERPGLRRVSVAALIMLVLQYGLGTILNLYVQVPPADAHAGIVTEIATAPPALTAHALLGVSLTGTAILLVTRAINRRERLLAVLAAAGLIAIGGAFWAGETFMKNGQDSASFAMAMLTGVALLCYIAIVTLASGTRPAPEQETQPLLTSVPAARPRERADYPDDWGAEPGWDDDPDWAGRLRQDADPGWPGRPGGAQRRDTGGWFTPELPAATIIPACRGVPPAGCSRRGPRSPRPCPRRPGSRDRAGSRGSRGCPGPA